MVLLDERVLKIILHEERLTTFNFVCAFFTSFVGEHEKREKRKKIDEHATSKHDRLWNDGTTAFVRRRFGTRIICKLFSSDNDLRNARRISIKLFFHDVLSVRITYPQSSADRWETGTRVIFYRLYVRVMPESVLRRIFREQLIGSWFFFQIIYYSLLAGATSQLTVERPTHQSLTARFIKIIVIIIITRELCCSTALLIDGYIVEK